MKMIINADCFEHIKTMTANSVDHIVTDPPYDIGFMNKDWDKKSIVTNPEFWKECLRVLKPGGYLLAFSHSRTSHRQTCAIEDAGFNIRDTIMWLYGSGFPKSYNVGKAIDALQSTGKSNPKALKLIEQAGDGKSYTLKGKNNGILGETVIWERKEYVYKNEWQGWGTALKPAYEPIVMARKPLEGTVADNVIKYGTGAINIDACRIEGDQTTGRFPANVILDELAGEALDIQTGTKKVSRFFYCPKANKKERNSGCDDLEDKIRHRVNAGGLANDPKFAPVISKNNHPTVKPIALMEYLIKLVSKEGQTILDPFAGSGSTGIACKNLKRKYILIERDSAYAKIIEARMTNEK